MPEINPKTTGVTFKLTKDRFRSNRMTQQPVMKIEQGDYDSVGLLQNFNNPTLLPRKI